MSFARMLVSGGAGAKLPGRAIGEEALSLLQENAFVETDLGVPLEIESGWVSAEHLLDTRLDHGRVVYGGGELGLFGLRIDTNKPPAELKRALRAQHESVLGAENPSGKPNRAQKAEAKQLAEAELHEKLSSGAFRRSSMSEVLWDVPGSAMLSAAGSNKVLETLAERFRTTFGGSLAVGSAGALGYQHLASQGRDRDYEDLRPTTFTSAPAGARAGEWDEGSASDGAPEVSWARSSGEPRDFLGNELLIWLWYLIDEQEGLIEISDPEDGNRRAHLALAMEKTLEMECAWGVTGKQTLREHAGGMSAIRMAEAAEALSLGKWPRKTGLIVADNSTGEEAGQVWALTLQADRWLVSGCALPGTEEEFPDARAEREWRLGRVRRIDGLLLGIYRHFLDLRTGPHWEEEREAIRKWIRDHRGRRVRGVRGSAAVESKPGEVAVRA